MTELHTRPAHWTVMDFMLAGVPRTEIDRRKAMARYLPMKECVTRYYVTATEDAQWEADRETEYEHYIETRDWRRDVEVF